MLCFFDFRKVWTNTASSPMGRKRSVFMKSDPNWENVFRFVFLISPSIRALGTRPNGEEH